MTTLEPLKLSCDATDCPQGLHYFGERLHRGHKKPNYPPGICRECGADLVDWTRTQRRDDRDLAYTIAMLNRECFRHEWWHREIAASLRESAMKRGLVALRQLAEHRLTTKVCRARNAWDGQQTRIKNADLIEHAQHATATCCRRCIEYWHGIKRGDDVSSGQLAYLTELIMTYIQQRLPDLPA